MNNTDLLHFIKNNHDSLLMVLDLIPKPIFIKDFDGLYLSCNTSFETFCGISREQLIGRTVHDLWLPGQADIFHAKDNELLHNPGIQQYETDFTNPNGEEFVFQYHKVTFNNSGGETAGLLGIIFDITETKQLEHSLSQLSKLDHLTQIPNRRAGFDQMEQVLDDSIRKSKQFSVAMIDIDHFKAFNDRYGHTVGDLVLKTLANEIKGLLRSNDILFRYGGEEFVICMPETSLDEIRTFAERMRIEVNSKTIETPDGNNLSCTLSVGISSFPEHGTHIKQLIDAGDRAMYDAKNSGRDCIQIAQ